jgi:hypothetical protein
MIPFILGALAAVGLSELSKSSKVSKMANGGGVSDIKREIDTLYSKSNFINTDFNWRLKLLEMLQDQSVEAYNIYKKLTKKQKDDVLQEQFEVDNDMGSYGDGDIETTKENLAILLKDAKNGKKYTNGGGFSEKAELKKREAGEFISLIFQSRDIAHKAHLKTDSFSAHKALNEYYDGILPLVDGLVESYQGMYGKIDIPEWKTDTKEIVPYLESVLKYIQEHKDKAFTDSSLLNQVDEIKAMVQGTLYKLKELN